MTPAVLHLIIRNKDRETERVWMTEREKDRQTDRQTEREKEIRTICDTNFLNFLIPKHCLHIFICLTSPNEWMGMFAFKLTLPSSFPFCLSSFSSDQNQAWQWSWRCLLSFDGWFSPSHLPFFLQIKTKDLSMCKDFFNWEHRQPFQLSLSVSWNSSAPSQMQTHKHMYTYTQVHIYMHTHKICIHNNARTHTHTHVHTCTHTQCAHTHTHTQVRTHTHTNTHPSHHAHTHTNTHPSHHIQTHTHTIHTCAHTHIHIQTHTHTLTHTHTHLRSFL